MIRNLARFLLILLCLLLPNVAAAQTDAVTTLQIVSVETDQFPEVTVHLRTTDVSGQTVPNLTNADFTVQDGDQLVESISVIDGAPLNNHTIIVLDLGLYSNLTDFTPGQMRSYLSAFVADGVFESGRDSIGLYAVNPASRSTTQQIVPLTNSAEDYLEQVASLDLAQTGGATSLDSIELAFDQLLANADPMTGNMSIVYIGSLFDDNQGQREHARREALRVANSFQAAGVRFYGLQTQFEDFTEPVQVLAENTGGRHLPFRPEDELDTTVQTVIEHIEAQGQTYQISFNSTNTLDGTRNISVATRDGSVSVAEAVVINVQPPVVSIASPSDEVVITRNATENNDGTFTYSQNSFPVEVQIEPWPDGHPRQIVLAELLVNGLPIQSIENPTDDVFRFNVDISAYEESTTLPIVFSVRDELNLLASSSTVNVLIEVTKPEILVATVVLTPTPGPTQTPLPDSNPCVNDPDSSECQQQEVRGAIPWAVIGILSLLLVGLFYRYRQAVGNAGRRIVEGAAELRKTLMGGAINRDPIGRLHILVAKPDRIDEVYEIFNDLTVIGRDPQYTDLQLYDADDSSSVSGRHCTIQYQKSTGKFLITDHSAAGTRVNNQRLEPDHPRELLDGAEITLGLISKSGGKLRFEVGKVDTVSPETMMDFDLQKHEENATIFDDFGNVTRLGNEDGGFEDNLGAGSASDDVDSADDGWLDDLE